MKRHKIFILISIILLFIIFVFAFIKVFSISRQTSDKLITLNIEIVKDIITQFSANHPDFISYFNNPSRSKDSAHYKELNSLSAILSGKNISGVKLVNINNQIIWDNTKQNIYDDREQQKNNELTSALNGVVSYKLGSPRKTENPDKTFSGEILKMYIPVVYSGKIIGAAEIYKEISRVELDIYNNSFSLLTLVMVFGLFALLFFILLKSNKSQSAMLKRLEETQDVTIYALAYLAEIRDSETGNHLNRTVFYVHLLAEELRKNNKYKEYITDDYISDLVKSTPLHDIGKVGIHDSILNKPGCLTTEEFDEMKKHCEYAVMILEKALARLSFQSFLDIAIQIASSHHEKWDGSGYPNGLSNDEIPLSARIMALADVYDALRSSRPYKETYPHDHCLKIIIEGAGKHFDPDVVNAFLYHEKEFHKISEYLSD
jgi:response regulator RpfG family c-di-GMP phosphodiesterase